MRNYRSTSLKTCLASMGTNVRCFIIFFIGSFSDRIFDLATSTFMENFLSNIRPSTFIFKEIFLFVRKHEQLNQTVRNLKQRKSAMDVNDIPINPDALNRMHLRYKCNSNQPKIMFEYWVWFHRNHWIQYIWVKWRYCIGRKQRQHTTHQNTLVRSFCMAFVSTKNQSDMVCLPFYVCIWEDNELCAVAVNNSAQSTRRWWWRRRRLTWQRYNEINGKRQQQRHTYIHTYTQTEIRHSTTTRYIWSDEYSREMKQQQSHWNEGARWSEADTKNINSSTARQLKSC